MLPIEIFTFFLFIVNGLCSVQEPRRSLEFSTNIDGYLLSKEEFQFSSQYYCIEIRNLLKADKCEKQLIKIARDCDSHPYEVLQILCDPQLLSTVFVNDNVLRIDDFLFTDSLAHLNFILEDGSCLRKTYLRGKPIPENIREKECSDLKQKVIFSKGTNTDFTTKDLGKSDNSFDSELHLYEALKMRGIEPDKPATFKMVKNVHYIIPSSYKRKRPHTQPSGSLQPQSAVEPRKPAQEPVIGNKNILDFDASKKLVVDNNQGEIYSQQFGKTNYHQRSQDSVSMREAESALPGKNEAEFSQRSADRTESVTLTKINRQEQSNLKQDRKEVDNGSQEVASSEEYGDSGKGKVAGEEIYLLHQNKDQSSEGYQLNIKIPSETDRVPQEKDKRSALDSFIQHAKNPLKRLSRRKEDVKGFSVVLVYDKNEET